MEFNWLARWQPHLLAVLRILTALLFLEHATMKFLQFPAPLMPGPLPPLLLAAGVIEAVTGLLMVVGLFTRLAAFIAAGEMAVAIFTVHLPKSFFPVLNGGEPATLFGVIFLYIAAAGPGAWSIDGARLRSRHTIADSAF